jgi:hypothetical protein
MVPYRRQDRDDSLSAAVNANRLLSTPRLHSRRDETWFRPTGERNSAVTQRWWRHLLLPTTQNPGLSLLLSGTIGGAAIAGLVQVCLAFPNVFEIPFYVVLAIPMACVGGTAGGLSALAAIVVRAIATKHSSSLAVQIAVVCTCGSAVAVASVTIAVQLIWRAETPPLGHRRSRCRVPLAPTVGSLVTPVQSVSIER